MNDSLDFMIELENSEYLDTSDSLLVLCVYCSGRLAKPPSSSLGYCSPQQTFILELLAPSRLFSGPWFSPYCIMALFGFSSSLGEMLRVAF